MQVGNQKFRRGPAAVAERRKNFRYKQMIRSAASEQNSDRSCSALKIPVAGRSGIPQNFGNSVSDYYSADLSFPAESNSVNPGSVGIGCNLELNYSSAVGRSSALRRSAQSAKNAGAPPNAVAAPKPCSRS